MKIFHKRSVMAKYMILSLLVLFFAFAALGVSIIVFVYPFEPIGKYLLGLLLGCTCTFFRLLIMDYSINKEMDMAEQKAKNYHQLMSFVRYGLLFAFAAVLIISDDIFGVYGGVIGILCLQLSAYGGNILLTRKEKRQRAAAENTEKIMSDEEK